MKVFFEMTDNTRKIITLLKKHGPLSKKDLADMGEMGWATVTKIINQLETDEIVGRLGTEIIDNGKRGKRAYLYDLSDATPLAIGVDVEYKTTTIILTNLKGAIQASYSTPTVIPATLDMAKDFFYETITTFIQHNPEAEKAVGIGMGIPGIGFPLFDKLDNLKRSELLEQWLSEKFHKPVSIQDNTKAYAIFEQWSNSNTPQENFIFLSIRSGVGSGIFHNGGLYIGTRGLAGEIGHIQVKEHGAECRCGKRGCLETIAGELNLYHRYITEIEGKEAQPHAKEQNKEIIHSGLLELFRLYSIGDEKAKAIVDEMIYFTAKTLSSTVMVLDIPKILISGHFGAYGYSIVQPLREQINSQLLPGTECTVQYNPFDPLGHVLGASLLVLKDFFINIRS